MVAGVCVLAHCARLLSVAWCTLRRGGRVAVPALGAVATPSEAAAPRSIKAVRSASRRDRNHIIIPGRARAAKKSRPRTPHPFRESVPHDLHKAAAAEPIQAEASSLMFNGKIEYAVAAV